MILLMLIANGMQYIAGQVNYRQQRTRILNFLEDARTNLAASAPKGRAPSLGKTFVEVGGRAMRCEVKGEMHLVVYPDERTGEQVHLNPEWVQKPTWRDLFMFSLPKKLANKVLGKKEEIKEVQEEIQEEVQEETEETEQMQEKKKKVVRKRGAPKMNKYK
ncbi:unnamed protein product [Rhizopus stolonifer]